jgi:hypothetical protein
MREQWANSSSFCQEPINREKQASIVLSQKLAKSGI